MRPVIEAVLVKYVGRKPYWKDKRSLYDSGLDFEQGQVREVPAKLGKSLLRHKDLFELATGEQEAATDIKPEDNTSALLDETEKASEKRREEEQDRYDLLDRIDRMQTDALSDFSLDNFQIKLDRRKSESNLRQEVKGFIEQFGFSG